MIPDYVIDVFFSNISDSGFVAAGRGAVVVLMLVMVLLVCDSVALHHHLGLYHQGTVLMINTSRELVLMQGHFYCFNCVYWLFTKPQDVL